MSAESQVQPESALVPPTSLGLRAARTTASLVGRRAQLEAIERELVVARRGLACIAVEGEPGIGKTRLLLAVEELATAHGFALVPVTADEEIRGPFLLARSLFAAPAMLETAAETGTDAEVRRVVEALLNHDEAGLEGMTSDRRRLRIFELAAVAIRAVAARQPLALLIDDLQWADEDSLRLLRYTIRPNARSPLLLVMASRREELASVEAAVSLLADLERMGVLTRLQLARLAQPESTELLQQLLGGPVHLGSAAIMHAQAEGVPFVLTEQLRAYRDAALIQQIDGVWTLARNAERLLPSAVRTLIQRREGRLPDATKRSLSEAAVLGRNFSVRDLREVRRRLGDEIGEAQLAERLAPAVAAGLLVEHPDGAAADYGFTHERVREFAAARLSPPERRAIHAAVVEILTGDGEPSPASLPLLARHAVAAGQTELGIRFSIDAARAALAAHAADEALRLIDLVYPVATEPSVRVELLRLRDDAYTMLRLAKQRLEGLAELSALAEALGEWKLEREVMLRRAAALRSAQDVAAAAELARRVRELAAEREDLEGELAACLELGQDLLGADLGEAYSRSANEADLDGAEEAFRAAVELAVRIGDDLSLAAASRELGVIFTSRVRVWFVERAASGQRVELLRRLAAGETTQELLDSLPIAPVAAQANEFFRQALEIYERIGDRAGAMNTIAAMAVLNWAPEIHLAGSARRIEELHRLMSRLKSLTNESQRALADAQMLYGSHVYARAKVFPDVALEKGRQAYAAARAMGDRALEFAVAGSLALTHVELDELREADEWLARAAEVASEAPSPWRARQLEVWRGAVCGAAGDAAEMRRHLENAARHAGGVGFPAERCGILARLALESARLGAGGPDAELLNLVENVAREVRSLVAVLPGHPPWGAQAHAALATRALAMGDPNLAAEHARGALQELRAGNREDEELEVVLPAAAALIAGGTPEEVEAIRARLSLTLGLITQRIADPGARVRWFRSRTGRELARLAGSGWPAAGERQTLAEDPFQLDEPERRLLRLLAEGRTNAEIADELGTTEDDVARGLAELYVRIGVSSRADATANAFILRMV